MTFPSSAHNQPSALAWFFALYITALILMLSLVSLKLAGVLAIGWIAAVAPLWGVWLLQVVWFGILMLVLASKTVIDRRRLTLPHATPHPIH